MTSIHMNDQLDAHLADVRIPELDHFAELVARVHVQKGEGNMTFHTARSTAYPQPVAGEGAGPAPLKVPADQLPGMLGVTSVSVVKHPSSMLMTDSTLA